MERIAVVGAGPGAPEGLTGEAVRAIARADVVYAADRHAALAGEKRAPLTPLSAALADMRARRGAGARVAVLVSGDPALFSLLPALEGGFGREALEVVRGVGALGAFCAALKDSFQGAAVLSAHGRDLSPSRLAHAVRTHERTFLFCDALRGPAWLSAVLRESGIADVTVAVGERLGYPEARLVSGTPEQIEGGSFDPLCVARVRNPRPAPGLPPVGIPDDEFIRGKTPMTKLEIRRLAVAALALRPDSVVWDVGAGTGSVSVECARQCPEGAVYAVEREAAALGLIRENAARFFATNLTPVSGEAPEALSGLPAPTHVFLGGSGGAMEDIIAHLEGLGPPLRLVAAAVTLESAERLTRRLSGWKNPEAAQVAVSNLTRAGAYHLFRAQNPVILFSADWEGTP
jgi:precorrin-6Y C5,15-methyltransferase (decarboxylating)